MRWDVYADLARPLTSDEQRAVGAALDEIVPDSGCAGPNRRGVYEVYFTVGGTTGAEAETAAADFTTVVLVRAQVNVSYVLTMAKRK